MIKDIVAIWRIFLYVVLSAMILSALNRIDEKVGKGSCVIEKNR
jgi:hypothetical protein